MEPELNPCEVLYERRCARYIYVVPDGLRELMSDISREVLRCQPTHHYTFIADYLDSLMITRENARVAAKFIEGLAETGEIVGELLYRLDITREQAERAAKVIQRSFRRHLKLMQDSDEGLDRDDIIERIVKRAKISREQANIAASTIQTAYKIHQQRRQMFFDITKVDWRVAARNSIGTYRNANTSTAERCEAATLIKAAYKGYYTRKLIKQLKAVETDPLYYARFYEDFYAKIMTSEVDSELLALRAKYTKAILVIQRAFKKHQQYKKEQFAQLQECLAEQARAITTIETRTTIMGEDDLYSYRLEYEQITDQEEDNGSEHSSLSSPHHEDAAYGSSYEFEGSDY